MTENTPNKGKPPEEPKETPQEETKTPLEKKRGNAVNALNAYLGSYFNAVTEKLGKNLDPTLEAPFAEKLIGRYEGKIRSRLGQINPGVKMVGSGGGTFVAPTIANITFEEIDATL